MARRLVGYAEDLSESTSTGSVVTKASITADLVNGTTYALFWSYQCGADDNSSTGRIRCFDGTGSASLGLHQFRARHVSDYPWGGGVSVYTAAATASRTFYVEFARTGGAGTLKIKTVRLAIVALTAADASGAAVGNQSTSSGSLVDALAVTFTPASTGDYLFIASASVTNGNTEIEFQTPGATSVNNCPGTVPFVGVYMPWSVVWRENSLAASSQTARIRWRSTSGAGQNLQAACLVAIRLDALFGVQNTQDDASDGGTQTSYTTTETITATSLEANVRDTIILASAALANNSLTLDSYIEFREAGTALIEGIHQLGNAALTTVSGLMVYKPTSSTSSITYDFRRKSESTNTTTTVFASIAVLELEATYPQAQSATLTGTASIRKSVQKRLSAAVTMTATLLARVLFARALVASITLTATMRREIAKFLSGSVTLTGTIVKTVHKALSAACTLTGSIAKAFPVHLVASLTATASMTRTIYKFLSGSLPMTGVLGKIKAVVVNMSASLGMTAAMRASTLFIRSLSASITLSATVQRTISKMLSAPLPVIARPIAWVASMFAATRHDKPNWNQCARCWRKQRPNKMQQQMEYRGPRLVWTGLYVCHTCLDDPQPQEIWPRETGGDPKPVILARPRRD